MIGALVGVLVGGIVLAVGPDDPSTTTVAEDDDDEPEVVDLIAGVLVDADVGDRLELRVEENPGIGDNWVVEQPPDEAVARIVGRFDEGVDPDLVGADHTAVVVLEATGPGTTTLILHNCYRCDAEGDSPPEDEQLAGDLEYGIRVG